MGTPERECNSCKMSQPNLEDGALHCAARDGSEKEVEHLIRLGYDIDQLDILQYYWDRFEYGTPLHVAVIMNHLNVVKVLVRCGADLNVKSAGLTELTPLEWAKERGNCPEIVEFLENASKVQKNARKRAGSSNTHS
eukprot:c7298_g1_i5.p1 GENE.c7298_g1_i5~~c7298_g1_i5.p1  ORF type:complete len:137 (+),score=23.89 c7298_g1_i5:1-411(+)